MTDKRNADVPKKRRSVISSVYQNGKADAFFISILLVLLCIGLVMLFSASYYYANNKFGDSYKFIKQQAIYAAVGLVMMYVVSRIDYHVYKKFAWILYFGILVLLAVLLALPPMISGVDYKRWFVLGPVNFQPSEIAKFSVVLLFAYLMEKYEKKMSTFLFGFVFFLILLGAVCFLVVLEPHLSATVLIFMIGVTMMFVGGVKKLYLFASAGAGVGLGAVAILSGIVDYGSTRIKYWLDPWLDARGKGFQTIQSLLAIGSGGFLGKGLGQSRQKYLWVPEPHNDFIFSIVCEELGLVGAMLIILLFCLLVWRGFTIAARAKDRFGSLLALGLSFQVGLQALLNILVVTNTIPNTGISLPFFSYGGTSMVILLCEMGIVLSVSRSARMPKS